MQSDRPAAGAWVDRYNARLFLRINQARKEHGLRPVRRARCVDSWASSWSRSMATHDDFNHSDLGGLLDLCDATYASENIAMIYDGAHPRDLVRAWMASPGHRANILSPKARYSGISVRWDSDQASWIAVQNFMNR